jgi:hypothetical protein
VILNGGWQALISDRRPSGHSHYNGSRGFPTDCPNILYYFDQLFGHMPHRKVRVFFFIRLKSKEKISAISATKKSKFFEELVKIVQYWVSLLKI